MNYLAHAFLARSDEGLMLGGLFGDHVRGRRALAAFPAPVRRGIRLHRHVDSFTDRDRGVKRLLKCFPRPFRRYAGIIVDLVFDHQLALRWDEFASSPLADFDREIRALLARHRAIVPAPLAAFMRYADRRGLFASYREEAELFHSLAGVGRRLRRANPLADTASIWPVVKGPCAETFEAVFPRVQSEVGAWISRTSTTTGS